MTTLESHAMIVLEVLENRTMLSVSFEQLSADEAVAAGARKPPTPGPAIRLDLVALHEFGHSLGLGHSSDAGSIMYAYYNAGYNLASFASDSAVAELQEIYTSAQSGPWRDSLDGSPGDGVVQITYSFVPDGTKMDGGKNTSNLFASFNALYGSSATWQDIFVDQLDRWAAVSNGILTFVAHSDAGKPFNYVGAAQNDPSSGDIRIGAHKFDGPGKVLGHTYYPPPNGATAAGDSHYDFAENWDGLRSATVVGAGAIAMGGAQVAAPCLFGTQPVTASWTESLCN
jgi:hypothetical protein